MATTIEATLLIRSMTEKEVGTEKPMLMKNELLCVKDRGFKIGDGVKTADLLPYTGGMKKDLPTVGDEWEFSNPYHKGVVFFVNPEEGYFLVVMNPEYYFHTLKHGSLTPAVYYAEFNTVFINDQMPDGWRPATAWELNRMTNDGESDVIHFLSEYASATQGASNIMFDLFSGTHASENEVYGIEGSGGSLDSVTPLTKQGTGFLVPVKKVYV